jgi:NAD+ diphosphatase
MTPVLRFQHCPACGEPRSGEPVIPFTCGGCGFVFYFNPTAAAAAIIARSDGRVLFITRAKEPARDKLAFPGGFIDIGETVEKALRRETLEEVGLKIRDIRLLCSHPNEYEYKGVTYPVLDFLFSAHTDDADDTRALDGGAEFLWRDPHEVELDDLAFPSLREGLRIYRERT